jgi:hypothetical protein
MHMTATEFEQKKPTGLAISRQRVRLYIVGERAIPGFVAWKISMDSDNAVPMRSWPLMKWPGLYWRFGKKITKEEGSELLRRAREKKSVAKSKALA